MLYCALGAAGSHRGMFSGRRATWSRESGLDWREVMDDGCEIRLVCAAGQRDGYNGSVCVCGCAWKTNEANVWTPVKLFHW